MTIRVQPAVVPWVVPDMVFEPEHLPGVSLHGSNAV